MKYALIISSLEERYYYDEFVSKCNEQGFSVGILDPELFISDCHKINILWRDGTISGTVTVTILGENSNSVKVVDIDNIKVAWYLRVVRKSTISEMPDLEERFKWSEMLYSLESLYSVLDCPWINTWQSIEYISANKMYQQVKASKVGLMTPNTLLSNCPDNVISFTQDNDDTVLLKTIGSVQLDKNDEMVLFSELFESNELQQSRNALECCPVFSQQYIPKKFEYRVMVIGNNILSCRIDSQASNKTAVDWRHYDFENVAHTAHVLPDYVQENLLKFMKEIDLRYGAIDMIETPGGEFVFLEINPSGQWHWISVLADLPIAESVAKMLKEAM